MTITATATATTTATTTTTTTTTTILQLSGFFPGPSGELVPEETFTH